MKNKLVKSLAITGLLVVSSILIPMPSQADSNNQIDFKDVPKTHSFYKEINTMRDEGIIKGYPDNTFKPTQPISRVHVASLFVRSLDLKPVRPGKEFKDIPKSSVYYKDVQTVYRAGIFDGNTNGTFGANDNLTRAQMAKVLVNAFNLDLQKGYIFDDINSSHWAKDYIATLYTSGITVGSNGKYLPNDSVTRAHYSAFLYRALHPEDAPKPKKPLQSTPPVVKKPEPKPTPQPKPTPPDNGVQKPGEIPAGATIINDNGLSKLFSYYKKLPDGSHISQVVVMMDEAVMITGNDKNGTIFIMQYNAIRKNYSYMMSNPSFSNDTLLVLQDVIKSFADAHGF